MKIDQEEFNRKAQHILDTVVKPQVERYEKANRLNKLEQLASLLQSAWINGDWKAETPNEREMEKIMVELGYWKEKNDGGNPDNKNNGMTDDEAYFMKNFTAAIKEPMMSPTDLENERFKHNASDYNPAVREKDHPAGETTIEFPKAHQPEPYNPNKPSLDWITFKFEQEENCVDGGAPEQLIVEAKSSLGIDGDGGAFYVLRTEQWAISDISDMIRTLERVKAALDATKPTSIHVK